MMFGERPAVYHQTPPPRPKPSPYLHLNRVQAYHQIGLNATFIGNIALGDTTYNPGAPQLTSTVGGSQQAAGIAERQGCGVGGGGGICIQLGPAQLVLINATLYGNRAVSGGGVRLGVWGSGNTSRAAGQSASSSGF